MLPKQKAEKAKKSPEQRPKEEAEEHALAEHNDVHDGQDTAGAHIGADTSDDTITGGELVLDGWAGEEARWYALATAYPDLVQVSPAAPRKPQEGVCTAETLARLPVRTLQITIDPKSHAIVPVHRRPHRVRALTLAVSAEEAAVGGTVMPEKRKGGKTPLAKRRKGR